MSGKCKQTDLGTFENSKHAIKNWIYCKELIKSDLQCKHSQFNSLKLQVIRQDDSHGVLANQTLAWLARGPVYSTGSSGCSAAPAQSPH